MYYNFNIFDQINPALVSKGNLYIKKKNILKKYCYSKYIANICMVSIHLCAFSVGHDGSNPYLVQANQRSFTLNYTKLAG